MREVLRLLGLALAALLCAYPSTLSDDRRGGLMAVLACAAAVNALVLWSDGAVTFAAAVMAAAYVGSLYLGDVGIDPFAPVFAAALLVFVEVADTALAVPALRPVDRSVLVALLRSCARITVLALVSGVVVVAGALGLGAQSSPARLAAMLGAVVAIALPLRIGRRETASWPPGPRT
jgi:hypothetical protein